MALTKREILDNASKQFLTGITNIRGAYTDIYLMYDSTTPDGKTVDALADLDCAIEDLTNFAKWLEAEIAALKPAN